MYASNSDQRLVKAIPVTNESTGFVVEWLLTFEYAYPASDFVTTNPPYVLEVDDKSKVRSGINKTPEEFTLTELMEDSSDRDAHFDTEYRVFLEDYETPILKAHENFDISTLSE